ncbi:hypothetical protein BDZ89DRAFT_566993 [Hymenopellis radicata]|nr:hypothetical protein BDZ89DRAFT_566993 [Hymenopellis radicata]
MRCKAVRPYLSSCPHPPSPIPALRLPSTQSPRRTMSIDPTTIISLIEQCVKVYEYLKDVKESSYERSRFMREVSAFKGVLRDLQDQLGELAENRSLVTHLARLLDPKGSFATAMKRTLQDLEDKLVGGVAEDKKGLKAKITKTKAAILWTLDKSEVETLLTDIERYKSLISLALQDASLLKREMHKMILDIDKKLSAVTEVLTDVAVNVDAIAVTISADEHLKVAEWISKISFSAFHAENSRKWLPGTGTWVLESPEFQEWESRTSSSPTLWCYGDAGAGKSVIAAMIVEHLQSIPKNVVLVIVCRYNQDREYLRETYAFMCCLLRQLLQLDVSSTVPQSLLDLYRKDIHPSGECVRTLLIETARIISRPIFIVVDALDECPLGFDLIAAIQRLGGDFNLLITSRRVFTQIEDYPSLCIRAADDDILAAINNKIPILPYVRDDEDLQTTVCTEVVTKANGMFLLASLMLWELEHDVSTKADVRKVLASIPDSLDDAYHLIFERIGSQGARKMKLALHTIMWIYTESQSGFLSSLISPTYSQLRVLLACEISTSEPEFQEDHMPPLLDIINACSGLLTISGGCPHGEHDSAEELAVCLEESTTFSFIHYSAYEYICHFQSSVLPQDPYQFTFNICTIALRHIEHFGNDHQHLQHLWLKKATFMDCTEPALVQSALVNTNFNENWEAVGTYTYEPGNGKGLRWISPRNWPEWLKTLVSKCDSNINSLNYAALFGLRSTFRLARETKAPLDEHHFQQVMEILVTCHHWNSSMRFGHMGSMTLMHIATQLAPQLYVNYSLAPWSFFMSPRNSAKNSFIIQVPPCIVHAMSSCSAAQLLVGMLGHFPQCLPWHVQTLWL